MCVLRVAAQCVLAWRGTPCRMLQRALSCRGRACAPRGKTRPPHARVPIESRLPCAELRAQACPRKNQGGTHAYRQPTSADARDYPARTCVAKPVRQGGTKKAGSSAHTLHLASGCLAAEISAPTLFCPQVAQGPWAKRCTTFSSAQRRSCLPSSTSATRAHATARTPRHRTPSRGRRRHVNSCTTTGYCCRTPTTNKCTATGCANRTQARTCGKAGTAAVAAVARGGSQCLRWSTFLCCR